MYRSDGGMMCIHVRVCGQSALGEHSRGELARSFARMCLGKSRQNFETTLGGARIAS